MTTIITLAVGRVRETSHLAPLCVSSDFLRAVAPRLCGALTLSVSTYRLLWRVAPQTMPFARSVTVVADRVDRDPPLPLPFNLRHLTYCENASATSLVDWTTLAGAVEIIDLAGCDAQAVRELLEAASTRCQLLRQLSQRGIRGDLRLDPMLRALPRLQALAGLELVRAGLSGTLDLTALPPSLLELDLSTNQLTGALDLATLQRLQREMNGGK